MEGLDVPLGFIDNLMVFDSTIALTGCGICSVAMLSRAILPHVIKSNYEALQQLKQPKQLAKSGIQTLIDRHFNISKLIHVYNL